MGEELRLVLSLLGALAVGAVVLHGIWTVRKSSLEQRKQAEARQQQEQPEMDAEEQEVQALKIKQMEIDFSDFEVQDEKDGLPVVDVNVDSIYKQDQELTQQTTQPQAVTGEVEGATDQDIAQVNVAQEGLFDDAQPASQVDGDEHDMAEFLSHTRNLDTSLDSRETEAQLTPHADSGSFEVESVEESVGSFSAIDDDAQSDRVEPQIKPNIDMNTSVNSTDRLQGTAVSQTKAEPEPEKSEVLILFVDKPDGEMIEGARLLPLLLTLGFKFGEMDFFHRHQQSSGHGEVLFSLANMYNPGCFDIDHMEQVSTRGLSIFMTLPNAGEALQTFNMMHNAAKKIADEFGARVLDAQRQPLDVVRVRNYVDKIRKF